MSETLSPAAPSVAKARPRGRHIAAAASARRSVRPAPPRGHVDALTGLLNRAGLESAIASMETGAGALLCIDLGGPDALARLGDAYDGARDDVLREAAAALRTAVRRADAVGRLTGDDFVIVLDGLGDLSNAGRVADAAMRALQRVRVAGGAAVVAPRIGVMRLPPPRHVASMFAARQEVVGAA